MYLFDRMADLDFMTCCISVIGKVSLTKPESSQS